MYSPFMLWSLTVGFDLDHTLEILTELHVLRRTLTHTAAQVLVDLWQIFHGRLPGFLKMLEVILSKKTGIDV